eukprot:jgi/Bigna1/132174/aug1.16_g6882
MASSKPSEEPEVGRDVVKVRIRNTIQIMRQGYFMGLKFNNSNLHSSQTVLVFQFSLDYDYAIIPREAAAIKIITNFVEEDLMKSRAVTSLEQQAIGSFLSIIIRKVVHSPMTVLLLKKLEEREGEELVDVKINMKKEEKKKKSNSQQKPILNRSASLGSPVMKKELDDMLLPTSKDTISIAKEQKREGGYTIYKGLEHNPYVGTIRHAPNVDEIKDLADKVFETVMKQKWVPMKDPLVSDIIPLAARVLQLVSFEAGFGRDGEVNEEEVSIDIMHRVVEDLLPWKTEEDLHRARNLMMTAVPDAISKRLNLSTIEAIVASSEQQVMEREGGEKDHDHIRLCVVSWKREFVIYDYDDDDDKERGEEEEELGLEYKDDI